MNHEEPMKKTTTNETWQAVGHYMMMGSDGPVTCEDFCGHKHRSPEAAAGVVKNTISPTGLVHRP